MPHLEKNGHPAQTNSSNSPSPIDHPPPFSCLHHGAAPAKDPLGDSSFSLTLFVASSFLSASSPINTIEERNGADVSSC